MAMLNSCAGESILDLGCGDGALTIKIQEAGARLLGVDSSESMIRAAKTRGLSAEVGNGEKLKFSNQFDAVFSNAALHWMNDYAPYTSYKSDQAKPAVSRSHYDYLNRLQPLKNHSPSNNQKNYSLDLCRLG